MKDCPLCNGSRRIRVADIYTAHPSRNKYVGWDTSREIACGCTQLVPIKGRTA